MSTQALTPLTRDHLQKARDSMLELRRKQKLQNAITNLYRKVESYAIHSENTKFVGLLTDNDCDMRIIKESMKEAMDEIKKLFPDSQIRISQVRRCDEDYIEVSETDVRMLELVNMKKKNNTEPALIIDWS